MPLIETEWKREEFAHTMTQTKSRNKRRKENKTVKWVNEERKKSRYKMSIYRYKQK